MQHFGFTRRLGRCIKASGHWRPVAVSSANIGRVAKLIVVAMLIGTAVPGALSPTRDVLGQTSASVAFSVTPNLFAAGQAASAVLSVSSTGIPSAVLQPGDTFSFTLSPSIGTLPSVVPPVMVNSSALVATDFAVAVGPGGRQVVITYSNSFGKTFAYGDAVSVKINFTASAQTGSGYISFNSRFTRVVNGLSPYTTVSIVNFGTGPAGRRRPARPPGPGRRQFPPAADRSSQVVSGQQEWSRFRGWPFYTRRPESDGASL